MFRPDESKFQKNQKKVKKYVKILEQTLGNGFKIVGILEIGSFAKDEAVPSSDCDTRVFVKSPRFYAWQMDGGRNFDKIMKQLEKQSKEMQKKLGVLPRKKFYWFYFNEPVSKKIKTKININVEFGITDFRFSKFCLENSDKLPTNEMALLFQNNIIYDPSGVLKKLRKTYKGRRPAALIKFYKKRYLESLPEEIYSHLKPHPYDAFKLRKGGQLQWIKWAVGSLRNAAASKTWIETGEFIYKKSDILKFYKKLIPQNFNFVKEIYKWKCDKNIHKKLVEQFIKNPNPLFLAFSKKTKLIEQIIRKINELVPRETKK